MHGYKNVVRVTIMGLVILEVTLGNQYYTDRWAVHVEGGEKVARSLAEKYGFVYLDQIMPDYYHFQHRKVAKRSIRPSAYHHRNLATDPNVKWLEQQVAKRRVKRDLHFNDPKWPIMWYLNRGSGLDMNVSHAWSMGYTGKGVVVTILDDGIEKDHPDLTRNYDHNASYDVNGHDHDPQPRYDYSNENRQSSRNVHQTQPEDIPVPECRSKKFRQKRKLNAEVYQEYLLKERERSKKRRLERTPEQIEKQREQSRIRSQRYRAKCVASGSQKQRQKPKTRKAIEKLREYNRIKKRESRERLGPQKKRRVKEYDRKRKQSLEVSVDDLCKKKRKTEIKKKDVLVETLSAVRNTLQEIPKTRTDQRNKREFVKGLSRHYSEINVAERALGVTKEYIINRCNESPLEPKKRSDAISSEVKQQIAEYYVHPDVSTELPDMRKVVHGQCRHILQKTITQHYNEFKSDNPDVKIGRSKFAELKPENVKPQSKFNLNQCICEVCANVELKLHALRTYCKRNKKFELIEELKDKFAVVNLTLCPREGPYNKRECIERRCENCGVSTLNNLLSPLLFEDNASVYWYKWGTVTNESKSYKGLIKVEDYLSTLIQDLCVDVNLLSTHQFNALWQHHAFKKLTSDLPDGIVVMVLDFGQNYACFYQDEAQAAHWHHEQVTIHPVVCFFNQENEIVKEEIICLSSDMTHDAHAVNEFVKKAVQHLQKKRNLVIEHLIQFSDGCSSQYKSKQPFQFISNSYQDYGFPTTRCYFGSRHGKGPCDGATGVVKSFVRNAVKARRVIVSNCAEMFEFCTKNLTRDEKTSKRTFYMFEEIPRNEVCNAKTTTGTRAIHSVKSVSAMIVQTRNLSCFCLPCLQDRHDDCESQNHVDKWKIVDLYSGKLTTVDTHLSSKQEVEAGDLMKRLQSCHTIELLKYALSTSNLVLPSTFDQGDLSIVNLKCVVDEISMKIKPSDIPLESEPLFPALIQGDGNCLPRCGSLLMYGTEIYHKEMRLQILSELIENQSFYLCNTNLRKGAENCPNQNVCKQFAMYSEQFKPGEKLSDNTIRTIFQREVLAAAKIGTYMGLWELAALSSILKRPLVSCYPKFSPKVREDVHRVFYPRQTSEKTPVHIMWTRTSFEVDNGTHEPFWSPNHFVVLLPLFLGQVSDSLKETESSFDVLNMSLVSDICMQDIKFEEIVDLINYDNVSNIHTVTTINDEEDDDTELLPQFEPEPTVPTITEPAPTVPALSDPELDLNPNVPALTSKLDSTFREPEPALDPGLDIPSLSDLNPNVPTLIPEFTATSLRESECTLPSLCGPELDIHCLSDLNTNVPTLIPELAASAFQEPKSPVPSLSDPELDIPSSSDLNSDVHRPALISQPVDATLREPEPTIPTFREPEPVVPAKSDHDTDVPIIKPVVPTLRQPEPTVPTFIESVSTENSLRKPEPILPTFREPKSTPPTITELKPTSATLSESNVHTISNPEPEVHTLNDFEPDTDTLMHEHTLPTFGDPQPAVSHPNIPLVNDPRSKVHDSDVVTMKDPECSAHGHTSSTSSTKVLNGCRRHGTRCAGEVAAQADNGVCNVGVAFNARIGGVRMLDGDVTDSVEAQSLGLNPQHIDIYSASWGPDDDGRTVDGPATLARKAFYDGITKGRNGKGSIFVWASGNGGRDGDNCNCDGYTNSIYTLSISSVTENGNIPWYSEACSSTLATTYSSGSGGEKQIVTTDLRKTCTENHTGTSASAPLAAGLIALGLEANPKLTWRDMQHIVVETAKPDRLKANDWVTNGVGKNVSHSFGFGLMDAGSIASLAKVWEQVPPQHICEIRSSDQNRAVPANGRISVPLDTNSCEGTANHVKYLEHVQARITMSSSRRGEIQIFLTSPAGTRSTLLAKRVKDNSREGFNNWAFMTTHNWGEYAEGRWILEIENGASSFQTAKLRDWVLVLYGTDRTPWKKSRPGRAPPTRAPPPMYPPHKPYTTRPSTNNNKHRNHWPNPELKEWTLVVMGTGTHPLKDNHTPPSKDGKAFTCAGVKSNGICIECKPGYFKLGDGCVAHCPEHYYGSVEAVQLVSPIQANYTRPLVRTQGICAPCHSSCLTCRGARMEECFQCSEGYERKNDLCQKKMIWDFLDPDVMKHLAWAIILCIGAILLFSVLFGLLQARDHRRLCWSAKRFYVPDLAKGHYNGVSRTCSDDPESQSESGSARTASTDSQERV